MIPTPVTVIRKPKRTNRPSAPTKPIKTGRHRSKISLTCSYLFRPIKNAHSRPQRPNQSCNGCTLSAYASYLEEWRSKLNSSKLRIEESTTTTEATYNASQNASRCIIFNQKGCRSKTLYLSDSTANNAAGASAALINIKRAGEKPKSAGFSASVGIMTIHRKAINPCRLHKPNINLH